MSTDHFRKRLFPAVVLTGALAGPSALAVAPEEHSRGEERHLDARTAYNAQARFGFSLAQQSAAAALRQNESTGLVRSLTNPVGALSEPRSGDALVIGLDFVMKHSQALGLEQRDLAPLEVTNCVYGNQRFMRYFIQGLKEHAVQPHLHPGS
jgi:extracellular elastinolytic metalloproteinase